MYTADFVALQLIAIVLLMIFFFLMFVTLLKYRSARGKLEDRYDELEMHAITEAARKIGLDIKQLVVNELEIERIRSGDSRFRKLINEKVEQEYFKQNGGKKDERR